MTEVYMPKGTEYNPFNDPSVQDAALGEFQAHDLNLDDETDREGGFMSLDLNGPDNTYGNQRLSMDSQMSTQSLIHMEQREKNLLKREQDLKKREAALAKASAGGNVEKTPNWPHASIAFFYHNIEEEIAEDKQPLIRMAYTAWKYTTAALTLNFLCIAIAAFGTSYYKNGAEAAEHVFTAALYLALGAPLSFMFWYMNLYRIAIKPQTTRWLMFGGSFVVHLIFAVLMVSGCPWYPFAGFFLAITCIFQGYIALAITAVINTAMWVVVLIYSTTIYRAAKQLYTSSGASVQTEADLKQGFGALIWGLHAANNAAAAQDKLGDAVNNTSVQQFPVQYSGIV